MDAADTDKIAKVVGAIDQLSAGIESLKALGVIRSRKAFADFAEWVVAQIFGGELAPCKVQPGWDVLAHGERLQVRSHSKAADNPNRWSTVKGGDFDSVVIVVLNESLRVTELYKVPAGKLLSVQFIPGRLRWDDLAGFPASAVHAAFPHIKILPASSAAPAQPSVSPHARVRARNLRSSEFGHLVEFSRHRRSFRSSTKSPREVS
ncbi:MAG TPA: hypothetical protein VK797_26590 [Tepidisphaeraceae bacterium]|jgi:hypothetical protein|nr:hypothetical protein [Tepidisphaeraceae bacterium]